MQPRIGISFPLQGEPLAEQAAFVRELESLGYSDVWNHQEWLGNERYYTTMWKCWEEGDVRGARAALSDEACDRLYIHGSAETCCARIQEYFDAGLDTAIIGLLEEALDPHEAVRLLAPV